MANILVTGATGFVGRSLCDYLCQQGHQVTGTVRNKPATAPVGWHTITIPSIDENTQWAPQLQNIDIVVHCAAINSDVATNAQQLHSINVLGAKNLAAQAIEAKVGKFIHLSSAKVYGENSSAGTVFSETATLAPPDAYAQSKADAEQQLNMLDYKQTQLLILRPPLIYGAGMKGNFFSLLKLCSRSIPLPFGLATQPRSFLYIGNLLSFVQFAISNSCSGTVNICDPTDLSLKQLSLNLRQLMNKPSALIPIPIQIFLLLAIILRKRGAYNSLFGPLCINRQRAYSSLGWSPSHSSEDGLKLTLESYQGTLF